MKFQFEIKNRAFFFAALAVSFVILLSLAIAITAPSPVGHTSNEVMISINGAEKTLQSAIDSKEILTPKCIVKDVSCQQSSDGSTGITVPDYALSGYTDAQCEWIEGTLLIRTGYCARCGTGTTPPTGFVTSQDIANTPNNNCNTYVSGMMRCCNYNIQ